MSWLTEEHMEKLRRAARSLTPEQREVLTWEQASQFRPEDTLMVAQFQGLQDSGEYTPWEAVVQLLQLQEKKTHDLGPLPKDTEKERKFREVDGFFQAQVIDFFVQYECSPTQRIALLSEALQQAITPCLKHDLK